MSRLRSSICWIRCRWKLFLSCWYWSDRRKRADCGIGAHGALCSTTRHHSSSNAELPAPPPARAAEHGLQPRRTSSQHGSMAAIAEHRLAGVHRLHARCAAAGQRAQQRDIEQLGEVVRLQAEAAVIAVHQQRGAVQRAVFQAQRAQQVLAVARHQDRLVGQQQGAVGQAEHAAQADPAEQAVHGQRSRRNRPRSTCSSLMNSSSMAGEAADLVFRQAQHEQAAGMFARTRYPPASGRSGRRR